MRLWHERLIPELPYQQLLGQHRQCCALRGLGWNKKYATINYVFEYSPYKLYEYHMKVLDEMKERGYQNDPLWEDPTYRGKNCPSYNEIEINIDAVSFPTYKEHDITYLKECLLNLACK